MSPVRGSDNGPSRDEAMKYAPRKARPAEARSTEAYSPLGLPPAEFDGALPSRLTPRREPPRTAGRRANTFGGDAAVAELRTRLALQPHHLDELPTRAGGSATLMWAGRITGVAVVLAVGFTGYRWGAAPHPAPVVSLAHPASQQARPQPVAAHDTVTARSQDTRSQDVRTQDTRSHDTRSQDAGQTTVANAVPVAFSPPGRGALPPAPRIVRQQLALGTVPALAADTVARLPVTAPDAVARAAVVIGGLLPGAMLSAGQPVTPTAWRVAVTDLPVAVTPPQGFSGVMSLNLELRAPDGTVADRGSVRLEWIARSAPAAGRPAAAAKPRVQHDAGEIALIIRRGEELMKNGDAASARLMYQRAAEAGDATAAFRLAETYDPAVRSTGLAPDADRAHTWYARAKDLGFPMAAERLDRLPQ